MILCLDYGSRYIGVAITDYDEKMAVRHSVIDQKQQDAPGVIEQIVIKEAVSKVLVGVPISLSGNVSEQTKVSQRFMEALTAKLGPVVEIEGVDETLTSVEADRRIKAEGGNKEDAHMEAARIMLVDYLEKLQ